MTLSNPTRRLITSGFFLSLWLIIALHLHQTTADQSWILTTPESSHQIMPSRTSEWNEGEEAMHNLFKVSHYHNPSSHGFPRHYGFRLLQSPLVALGTLDSQGRPWATVWGGERGFARLISDSVVGLNSAVSRATDPVFEALYSSAAAAATNEQGVVRPDGRVMVSGLGIDLETRDRVKIAGRMLAGAAGPATGGRVQMAVLVEESLGNCPKYLNKKAIKPHDSVDDEAEIVSDGLPLPEEAVDLLHKADLFFMSSTDGETMDANHRGGPPGFVRVLKNDEGGVELVYPEYSGNRLYQSLGNLKVVPKAGIVIPDFETGNVLYVTGTAAIMVGEEALSVLARTRLAVKITVTGARYVRSGLPFRGDFIDYSPYNPPVRYLVSERTPAAAAAGGDGPAATATLVGREILTPSINRFKFELSSPPKEGWQPGQHVTLDFSGELDHGWSHMNDRDPQSINDDYVRTFTVSSPAPTGPAKGAKTTFEITARRHGPATNFLWRHQLRVPLQLPVLGFGGKEGFRLPTTAETGAAPVFAAGGEGITPLLAQGRAVPDDGQSLLPTAAAGPGAPVFIAGGVGITPLLAQGRAVLDANLGLQLLWSLRAEDLALAADTFEKLDGLAAATTLYVTGDTGKVTSISSSSIMTSVEKLREMGARVEERRMGSGDLEALRGASRKFFLCAAPGLLKRLTGWLEGEEVVWEDFSY